MLTVEFAEAFFNEPNKWLVGFLFRDYTKPEEYITINIHPFTQETVWHRGHKTREAAVAAIEEGWALMEQDARHNQ